MTIRTILLCCAATVTCPSSRAALPQSLAIAHASNSAADLHIANGIIATKPNDSRLYLLLGSGFIRATSFGDPGKFVSDWLAKHPKASITPISRILTTNTITHVKQELVYIWIEDGAQSLNVDLVRGGVFAGGTMYDMVDNQRGLDRLLNSDPKLAGARADIEKRERRIRRIELTDLCPRATTRRA